MERGGKTALFWLHVSCVFSSASSVIHFHHAMFTYTTGLVTIPDRMAVTYIDDVQITRYDSRSKTLTSSCGWVKTAMNESWKYYEDLCTSACNRRREDFSEFAVYVGKKEDLQTFQWISHCIYDDQKGVCEGYEKYGYNGEDFISLEVKQMRYVPHTPDAAHITDIWNKQRDRIDEVKHYFTKEFPVYLKRAAPYLTTAVFPDVYLLQKNSSSPLVCLATGFNSSAVTMIWRKNGQDLHEDVDEGETLPNGDGTFQKRISLKVETEEWKENQYRCVVQQENWKKMIIKNVTEDEIKHNLKHRTHVAAIISTIIFLLVLLLLPFLMRLHRG